MKRNILIVGAGIVGSCLAQQLSLTSGTRVTVLDRASGEPRGSTSLAPGFVGLYNDSPVLTRLAKESAEMYERISGTGFVRSGGLELATSEAGASEIIERVKNAQQAGLRASVLDGAALPSSVRTFVDPNLVNLAASYADDGSADVQRLAYDVRRRAMSQGAQFIAGQQVTHIDHSGPRTTVITAEGRHHACDVLILAAGIWGSPVAKLVDLELPIFPVAHPYAYSPQRPAVGPKAPFVRWPKHHVYARLHHNRIGIGSYNHTPIPATDEQIACGASLPWTQGFSAVIDSAQRLLRSSARFDPERRTNGAFAMTPDNLPFVGPHPNTTGIWVAQALWVTHAAGAAAALANRINDTADLPHELAINRFDGSDTAALHSEALRLYRDIYAHARSEDVVPQRLRHP